MYTLKNKRAPADADALYCIPTKQRNIVATLKSKKICDDSLVSFPEIFFGGTTFGANPIFGDLLPGSAWVYTIFIVALFRVINIAAWAFPFLHNRLLDIQLY